MISRRTLALTSIAALSSGYGLTRSSGLFESGEALGSMPDAYNIAGAPTAQDPAGATARLNKDGVFVGEAPRIPAPAASTGWSDPPARIKTRLNERLIDYRVSLGVGNGEAWAPQDTNPVDIGPYLDANDSQSWESYITPATPIEIGAFLDAGMPRNN